VVQEISCARYVALGGAVKWHVSQRRQPPAPALWRCAEPQGGSAEFRSGPKISGTTLYKVIRFCSAACRTGVLYFGTGTEVVPGKPVVIPPAERALSFSLLIFFAQPRYWARKPAARVPKSGLRDHLATIYVDTCCF
jgi:hypothetical protein